MTKTISERLQELGFELDAAGAPVATYVSTTRAGDVLLVSGQISQACGKPAFHGRLGDGVEVEEGVRAARSAALALVAQIAAATGDRLEAVSRILRLRVFIATAPGFTAHSAIADGASDLLVAVWGDAGRHARTAVGVASLPAGVSVEIDADVELASL